MKRQAMEETIRLYIIPYKGLVFRIHKEISLLNTKKQITQPKNGQKYIIMALK
jgi:hypothetical protein